MVCYAAQQNSTKPFRGNSGASSGCVATLFGFSFGDTMKKVLLANNKGFVLVDNEDYEQLNSLKWHRHINKAGNCYAKHTKYLSHKYPPYNEHIFMHRLIMGATADQEIDHEDRNGLNNQKNNLRICSRTQNAANSRKRKGCGSIYKGVYFNKRLEKWHVRVKGKHIGYYRSEVKAAQAYDEEAVVAFGDFARLNFQHKVKARMEVGK